MLTVMKNIINRFFRPAEPGYTPDIEETGRRTLFTIFLLLLILPLLLFGGHLIFVRKLYFFAVPKAVACALGVQSVFP